MRGGLASSSASSDCSSRTKGRIRPNSFKARGLSAAVSMAKALGIEPIALPTAGNAGGAAAAYAARAGLRCVIAMPRDTPSAIVLECRAFGADVHLIDGLISDCGAFIAEQRGRARLVRGLDAEGAVPHRRQEDDGLRAVGGVRRHAARCHRLPDWRRRWPDRHVEGVRRARGDGAHGTERPRMIAAQAEGCAPIVRAFERRESASVMWDNAATVAAGLRVPKPLGDFLILADVYASGGEAVAVSDDEPDGRMRARWRGSKGFLRRLKGAQGSRRFASWLTKRKSRRKESVVLFNTGSGYKYLEAWQSALHD